MIAFMFYDVVLAIHILAVVIAFGVVFAYPVLDAVLKGSGVQLSALHRLHVALATRLVQPAMTVVLLAGLYLALDRDVLGKPWVSGPFAILVILFGLTGAVLVPTDKRLAELAERDQKAGGPPSADYLAESRKADIVGSIALLLVVVAIFLMTVKPGM
ncbi:MAG: hypothetical protein QOJ46_2485 [bacterium]|jgi:uncharacterized membrane protein